MGQLLLFIAFFLCNFFSFFSYVGGFPVTNLFLLLLIDRYIFWLQYSANYNKLGALMILFLICSDLLNCLRSVGTMVITKKWPKQPQSHFRWAISQKSHHFLLFWCMLCTTTQDISSSSENINISARVSRLSFRFLWLWLYLSRMKQISPKHFFDDKLVISSPKGCLFIRKLCTTPAGTTRCDNVGF